jgi:NAD(P)-dependent dehydrogenase (short-subunit alcohol dehydrogenase family)
MTRPKLEGTVAIVTGGASGIGRALAEELAGRGCEVVIADRQGDAAEDAARAIRGRGARGATGVALDVRDKAAFDALAKDTVTRAGRIDYLFNNAGIAIGGDTTEVTAQDFDDVIDVNLRGVVHGILAVYPTMIAQRSGHIVNTASMAGLMPSPSAGSYTATKHAVVGLSKSLRIEGLDHGIRVSVLCPGAIRTPILTGGRFGKVKALGATAESVMRQWERVRPMDPADFARKAVDRVLANDPIIVLPSWWKVMWLLDRLSPSLSLALAARIHRDVRAGLRGTAAGAGTAENPAGAGGGTNGYHSARA